MSTEALAEMLDDLDAEPAPEMATDTAPPLPWTFLLWQADPETRIGRAELLEAVGRPASWLYRHTGLKAKHRILHRKLDGELIFLVGEVRRWLRDREEIVVAGASRGLAEVHESLVALPSTYGIGLGPAAPADTERQV